MSEQDKDNSTDLPLMGRVLYDKLLVERLPFEAVKPSGTIVVPDLAKEPPAIGRVIRTGAGRLTKETRDGQVMVLPLQVRPGDIVYFGRHVGWDITIRNKDYLILREDDVVYYESPVFPDDDALKGIVQEDPDEAA